MQSMWADSFFFGAKPELMMDWRCNRMIHYHYYVSISLTGKSIKSEAVKWSITSREKKTHERTRTRFHFKCLSTSLPQMQNNVNTEHSMKNWTIVTTTKRGKKTQLTNRINCKNKINWKKNQALIHWPKSVIWLN